MDTNARIALVTGANKGIGYEAARLLAGTGMHVGVAARDPERREKAVAALRSEGLDVHPIALDVTDPDTVRTAAEEVDRLFGRLDVLVNNAGIGEWGIAPSVADVDAVRSVFDTNLFGVMRVTNAMLPLLRRSDAARIVNVSSGVGSLTRMTDPEHYMSRLPPSSAYRPLKTALNALTIQYAKELRPDGILVNAAVPGACATDFTKDVPWDIPRTPADGTAIVVRLATLDSDGPTGGLFDDDGAVPW